MKDRIIHFLDLLSTGQADDLSRELEKALGLEKKTIRQRAQATLSYLLHHYGYFSVSTIDSFFQTIIRSFSREMGLLGNYDVEMDLDKVLDELIDKTFQEVGADPDLTRWLIAFAESRVEAGSKWDMRSDISNLAKEIFTEKFKAFETEMDDQSSIRKTVRTLSRDISGYKKKYEQNVRALAEKGLKIIEDAGLTPGRFKNGTKGGPSSFFQKILNDPAAVPNKLVLNGTAGYEAWITKNNPEEPALRALLDESLMDAYTDLLRYVQNEGDRYRGFIQFQQQIYTFGILADFIKKLESYRKENDVMLISDTNYFLKEIIHDNDTPFIYEKTGTQFKHFMIDEFQDTSDFQWENFKPLLQDSLSQGNDNMVVGDGKQSIYRFREGNWDLLNNRINKEIDNRYLSVVSLKTNYRSACNLVNFNNDIFSRLPAILKDLFEKKRNNAPSGPLDVLSRSYDSLYEDVKQKCYQEGGNHDPGYVKINFIPGEAGAEDWKNKVLDKLERQVESLLDAGITPGQIAILVRKKKEGAAVVNRLLIHSGKRSKHRYKLLSNESLFLDASWAVRLVIYGIRLINNEKDRLARAGILYEYLKNKEGITPEDGDIFEKITTDEMFERTLPGDLIKQSGALKLQPLPGQAESLIRIFGLDKSAEHTAFLSTLQSTLSEYADDISNITGDFLKWWEEKGKRTGVQIPEESDAISVLTIHKSKGLEYRAVILPFCNWKLDHEALHSPVLWCHSEDKIFKKLNRFPLRYSGSLIHTIFREDYLIEYGKTLIDNLNLLYVAMTRAKEILMINAKLPDEKKQNKNPAIKDVSDLLYEAFNHIPEQNDKDPDPLKMHYDPENHVFENGMLPRPDKRYPERADAEWSAKPYASNNWSDKIRIKNNSGAGPGPAFEQRKARITMGIIIHRVLSNIITASDTERQFRLLQNEGLLGTDDLDEVRKQIRVILTNDQVKPWFDGTYEIKTEIPILTRSGRKYKPDRVMLKGNEAIVVDFKTGEPSPSHAGQIKKYREILQQMGYEVRGTYLLYTRGNKVEHIK